MIYCLAATIFVLGAILAYGGLQLIMLGGSPYYFATGLTLLVAGVLVWRKDRRGAWLYLLMLLATLLWSIWEVSFNFNAWAFVPRLAGPFALGLVFLLPAAQRSLFGTIRVGLKQTAIGGVAIAAVIGGAVAFSPRTDAVAASGMLAQAQPDTLPEGMSDGDWPYYGRDAGGMRYSPLTEIGPQNVKRLKVAWTFHTGFTSEASRTNLEVTPLKIGDSVYLCDAKRTVFALDPDTGRVKWKFSPHSDLKGAPTLTCRGVTFYKVPTLAPGSECAERIFTSAPDARLWALDARTGKPCRGFGANGAIDLRRGAPFYKDGYYLTTSAPTIARGKIIVGDWFMDNEKGQETDVVRAFDAVSGRFAWAWDVGRPGVTSEPGANEVYSPNTLNVWAPMSVDETLGLVFMPTGVAFPDAWGGNRSAEVDKYSSAVVAIDADTGLPKWSFQTTHRDRWDYDVGSQPTLADWPVAKGKTIPALIQATKRGETFVLDRKTGRPIVPVHERPVPQGSAPGDRTAPTQPFSDFPSFAGPDLTEAMMWGVSPLDQLWCRIQFRKADYRGTMTPPSLRPSISYPGYAGGADWGGVSIDPQRMLMVMNVNRFAMYGKLVPQAEAAKSRAHGKPGGVDDQSNLGQPVPATPYAAQIQPFLSPLFIPCQQPPYGMIGVFDLRTRAMRWSRSLGTARDDAPFGLRSYLPIPLGSPNMGGAVITRSGLIFIGATKERRFRAFDSETGRELWSAALPAGAHATPISYRSDRSGRQFIVIASGGGPLLASGFSDTITAYALPEH
ncbi:membrane-bound PQQ-dependent dehydrogenase, glucose/quinate/shikimate family [Novosphingobium colocasiae]|uniref:membrane-bound PQQ-dependent dehydrogenase, glucose/quinate/shikimate family n=1 Tax=Novosphingobium colocasiae TaxID=1256513 RepID=UPI0035B32DEB